MNIGFMNNLFWATVLLIFLITIFTALLRRLAKDKALKLLHQYHAALFHEQRAAAWGDLWVFSQGLELLFDEPFTTPRGLVKTSSLLYDDEFTGLIALTRSVYGLTDAERQHRHLQIRRTFNPNLYHRSRRWLRNTINTMRDALSKTASLVIGRIATPAAGQAGAVLSSQAGDINALTGSVINLAANAYEPILERYIGKPVVVEIAVPQLPGMIPPPPGMANTVEFPGYLVDYTARFLAVFNVHHTPVESIEIALEPGKPPVPDLPDLKFTLSPETTLVACVGRDAFLLRTLCCTQNIADLGVAMIPGTQITFFPITQKTVIKVERTRQIDLVVPRSRARIHFASVADPHRHQRRRNHWSGIAPHLPRILHREERPTLSRNMVLTTQASPAQRATDASPPRDHHDAAPRNISPTP
ncbi:MAG: hypothetical protein ACTHN5_17920 [Phycisphaerae bacterium]